METQTTKIGLSKLALENVIDGLNLLAQSKGDLRDYDDHLEIKDLARHIQSVSADSHVTLTFTDIPQWAGEKLR
jgi:hypothetical protein